MRFGQRSSGKRPGAPQQTMLPMRLGLLVLLLAVVVVAMQQARNPDTWRWLFGRGQAAPQEEKIDTRLDPPSQAAPDRRGVVRIAKAQAAPPPEKDRQQELFPGVRPDLLAKVRDNTIWNAEEHAAFFHLLQLLKQTPEQQLRARARSCCSGVCFSNCSRWKNAACSSAFQIVLSRTLASRSGRTPGKSSCCRSFSGGGAAWALAMRTTPRLSGAACEGGSNRVSIFSSCGAACPRPKSQRQVSGLRACCMATTTTASNNTSSPRRIGSMVCCGAPGRFPDERWPNRMATPAREETSGTGRGNYFDSTNRAAPGVALSGKAILAAGPGETVRPAATLLGVVRNVVEAALGLPPL